MWRQRHTDKYLKTWQTYPTNNKDKLFYVVTSQLYITYVFRNSIVFITVQQESGNSILVQAALFRIHGHVQVNVTSEFQTA